MSDAVPEHICHNLEMLQENLLHYNPVVGRLIQLTDQLGFAEWPSQENGPLAIRGGLLTHSVETAMVMVKLHRTFDPRMQMMPPYSVMLVGLFHDVGKCGVEKYPFFEQAMVREGSSTVPTLPWRLTAMAKTEGHETLGLSLFDRAGVPLSDDERAAITEHTGTLDGHQGAAPLTMLLHFANMWSNARHREGENEHDGEGCSALAQGEHPSA